MLFLLAQQELKSIAGKLFYFYSENHYGPFPTKQESENGNLSILMKIMTGLYIVTAQFSPDFSGVHLETKTGNALQWS